MEVAIYLHSIWFAARLLIFIIMFLIQMIKGALHQVHNEPEGVGTECMEDIMKWIKDHC